MVLFTPVCFYLSTSHSLKISDTHTLSLYFVSLSSPIPRWLDPSLRSPISVFPMEIVFLRHLENSMRVFSVRRRQFTTNRSRGDCRISIVVVLATDASNHGVQVARSGPARKQIAQSSARTEIEGSGGGSRQWSWDHDAKRGEITLQTFSDFLFLQRPVTILISTIERQRWFWALMVVPCFDERGLRIAVVARTRRIYHRRSSTPRPSLVPASLRRRPPLTPPRTRATRGCWILLQVLQLPVLAFLAAVGFPLPW